MIKKEDFLICDVTLMHRAGGAVMFFSEADNLRADARDAPGETFPFLSPMLRNVTELRLISQPKENNL